MDSPLRKRNETFREIFKREREYVNNLQAVVKVIFQQRRCTLLNGFIQRYYLPLKENAKGYRSMITEKEMATIFCNMEGLLTVHEGMLQQFELIQNRWPDVDGVGDVFLTMVRLFELIFST